MRFVDDDEIIDTTGRPPLSAIIFIHATEKLERDQSRIDTGRREGGAPHRNQRRGSDYQALAVFSGDGERDVSLPQSDFVAQQRAIELLDGVVKALYRRHLMWMESDRPKFGVGNPGAEDCSRDPVTDFSNRRATPREAGD